MAGKLIIIFVDLSYFHLLNSILVLPDTHVLPHSIDVVVTVPYETFL